jgi:hypothetical protein
MPQTYLSASFFPRNKTVRAELSKAAAIVFSYSGPLDDEEGSTTVSKSIQAFEGQTGTKFALFDNSEVLFGAAWQTVVASLDTVNINLLSVLPNGGGQTILLSTTNPLNVNSALAADVLGTFSFGSYTFTLKGSLLPANLEGSLATSWGAASGIVGNVTASITDSQGNASASDWRFGTAAVTAGTATTVAPPPVTNWSSYSVSGTLASAGKFQARSTAFSTDLACVGNILVNL